jgi:hypothetical protein
MIRTWAGGLGFTGAGQGPEGGFDEESGVGGREKQSGGMAWHQYRLRYIEGSWNESRSNRDHQPGRIRVVPKDEQKTGHSSKARVAIDQANDRRTIGQRDQPVELDERPA